LLSPATSSVLGEGGKRCRRSWDAPFMTVEINYFVGANSEREDDADPWKRSAKHRDDRMSENSPELAEGLAIARLDVAYRDGGRTGRHYFRAGSAVEVYRRTTTST
jgi:hypothetical protein